MRRGRDVVLGESISAETGVNQRPAPPTPKVTIGGRFTARAESVAALPVSLFSVKALTFSVGRSCKLATSRASAVFRDALSSRQFWREILSLDDYAAGFAYMAGALGNQPTI